MTDESTETRVPDKPARGEPITVGAITRLSTRYADAFPLRSAIQAIPVLGGSLDTMLAGLGARWQYERLQAFIAALTRRLETVEGYKALPDAEPSEPMYDFIMRVFDHVIRTRSQQKREAFAAIVARQVAEPRAWDDADAAARLVADLSDVHIAVLRLARDAPPCGAPFDGLKVVTLSPAGLAGARLSDNLPGVQERVLRLACSELVARGLLHDEGVGRWDVGAMAYFVATELATWFLDWLGLQGPNEKTG